MYNHTITSLAYKPMLIIMFSSGIFTGGIIGLTLVLMNGVFIGILGAAFIALLTGLASGFFGLIFTAVFNTIAPAIGGIPLKIQPFPVATQDNTAIQPPACPLL